MFLKLRSSLTIWLGFILELLGQAMDWLAVVDTGWGGLDGLKHQIQEAGYDPGTLAAAFKYLAPLIVLARLRSLVKK